MKHKMIENMNEIPGSPDSMDMLNHNTTSKKRKIMNNGINLQDQIELLKTENQLDILKSEEDSIDLRQSLLQKNLELLKSQTFDTLDLRQTSFNLLKTNLEMLKSSQKNSVDLRLHITNDNNNDSRLESKVDFDLVPEENCEVERDVLDNSELDVSQSSVDDKDLTVENSQDDVSFSMISTNGAEDDNDDEVSQNGWNRVENIF